MKNIVLIIVLSLFIYSNCTVNESPISDAIWLFSGNPEKNEVEIHGNISLGQTLSDKEKKASFIRGGNGKITEFNGGWMSASAGKYIGHSSKFSGYEFTLHIRFQIPDGKWDKPIISQYRNLDEVSWALYGYSFGHDPKKKDWEYTRQNYWSYTDEDGVGYAIEFMLGVYPEKLFLKADSSRLDNNDIMNGFFRVGVPVSMIGSEVWHDITVRFTGSSLELFVDGVLVDEEWPIGKIQFNSASCLLGASKNDEEIISGLKAKIDYAAIWDRALSNGEIIDLNGGNKNVLLAEKKILGKNNNLLQYWRPRGHNTWAGDVMPAYDVKKECLHLFYLFDRRHHGSAWNVGKHQIAHLSTTDLIHWKNHPLAVSVDYQYESFGTGVPVILDDRIEIHFGMHTSRMFPKERTMLPKIKKKFECSGKYFPLNLRRAHKQWPSTDVPNGHGVAVSYDGNNFKKLDINITPAANMWIFHHSSTDQFYMIWGKKLLVSDDLRKWEIVNEDFLPVGQETIYGNSSECPNYFEWNGWHYIIMGGSGFWMSKNALGPYWEGPLGKNRDKVVTPKCNIYDGLYVPMVFKYKNNRRLLVGWTHTPMPINNWGGYLVFRELIQNEDGNLAMKWPDEMIPPSDNPFKWEIGSFSKNVNKENQSIHIESSVYSAAEIKNLSNSYHFSTIVVPGKKVKSLGINIKKYNDYKDGCELRLIPEAQHAQWGTPIEGGKSDQIPYINDRGENAPCWGYNFALDEVEGLNLPFRLDLIVKYDPFTKLSIIDACIDEKRTMVTVRNNLKSNSLFLFVENGEVTFRNVNIRSLKNHY